MADIAADLKSWSTTANTNAPAGALAVGTGLAPNLREIQKVVRQDLAHKGSDIASDSTADLGAMAGLMHDITGTNTITSFGTVSAGIWKVVKFEGALTLTHNATSLILPGGANITTADGDVGIFFSEGSGNWRCVSYQRKATYPGGFPSGTKMLFQQTAAPTGWTKDTTHNDKALRVVTGDVGSGGATAFTTVFGSGKTTGGHTLTTAEIPSHVHPMFDESGLSGGSSNNTRFVAIGITSNVTGAKGTDAAGGGGSHSHTLSLDLQYADVIIATKD